MRRILYFAAAVAVMLTGCNKNETVWAPEPAKVSIVSSNVIFDALGGNGVIDFQAEGAVKATSEASWCQVSVSGDKVNVSAEPNQDLNGRASNITLECGGQTVNVCAQQTGMVYTFVDNDYLVEMAGAEIKIMGESSFAVTAESQADWITFTQTEEGFILTIARNNSGDNRKGTFTITSADIKTVYSFTQKFDKDFSGSYSFKYYGQVGKTSSTTKDVTVVQDASDKDLYYIKNLRAEGDIPVRYDASKDLLYIPNGSYIGPSSDLYVYITVFYATSDLKSTYYNVTAGNDYYHIYFTYTYEDDKYVWDLYDSAPAFNSARTSLGFQFRTFTTAPGTALATANMKSNLQSTFFPSFTQQ